MTECVELMNPLLTTKYTKVYREVSDGQKFSTPHHFAVVESAPKSKECLGNTECVKRRVLARIDFQDGPIGEVGVNGVMNEDLIAMVITRLEGFQTTEFACHENAVALDKLYEALMWLRKRTTAREQRGVEGTYQI